MSMSGQPKRGWLWVMLIFGALALLAAAAGLIFALITGMNPTSAIVSALGAALGGGTAAIIAVRGLKSTGSPQHVPVGRSR